MCLEIRYYQCRQHNSQQVSKEVRQTESNTARDTDTKAATQQPAKEMTTNYQHTKEERQITPRASKKGTRKDNINTHTTI